MTAVVEFDGGAAVAVVALVTGVVLLGVGADVAVAIVVFVASVGGVVEFDGATGAVVVFVAFVLTAAGLQ